MKKYIEHLFEVFHKIPEIGWQEYKTTEMINTFMDMIDVERSPIELFPNDIPTGYPQSHTSHLTDTPYSIGETGGIYRMQCSEKEIKTVLRFDIDGLAISESHSHSIRSNHEGFMHACGHDHHIVLGLVMAKVLHEMKDQLEGSIVFVFQPAEEGLRGAYHFAKHPWLEKADYVIGQHVGIIDVLEPTLALSVHGSMGSEKIDLEFFGKSSHAALSPDEGRNALMSAIDFSSKIMQLRQDDNRINIGTLQGGSGRNVIPDYAKIEMEIRAQEDSELLSLRSKIDELLDTVHTVHGTTSSITRMGYAPPLVVGCDESLKDFGLLAGFTNVLMESEFLASEDFSHYKAKEKYYFLLSDSGILPHHHKDFAMPISIVDKGRKFLTSLILSKHAIP